jgi:ApbE superfamily uncharacterized protein (UPF0280 family)
METIRFYRGWIKTDLVQTHVRIEESDLYISADKDIRETAFEKLQALRTELHQAIRCQPEFKVSLQPCLPVPGTGELVLQMEEAGSAWKVGPMASVAGAISEQVGRLLMETCRTVIVENGGDIYAKSGRPLLIGLYAGKASPFSNRIIFEVNASKGVGICTSSGSVGHSYSYGLADAVVTIHRNAAMADAAATAIGNMIKQPADIEKIIEQRSILKRLDGLILCMEDKIAIAGQVQLHA